MPFMPDPTLTWISFAPCRNVACERLQLIQEGPTMPINYHYMCSSWIARKWNLGKESVAFLKEAIDRGDVIQLPDKRCCGADNAPQPASAQSHGAAAPEVKQPTAARSDATHAEVAPEEEGMRAAEDDDPTGELEQRRLNWENDQSRVGRGCLEDHAGS
jgi:hypothetical protein